MIVRTYLSTNKTSLAMAYDFKREETLVSRVRERLDRLTEEQLLKLGEWTGNRKLLPDQVEVIVYLLGNCANPKGIYTETRVDQ